MSSDPMDDLFAKIHHDLTGAIRNFRVALSVLGSGNTPTADALELMEESILQVEKLRQLVSNQIPNDGR